MAKQQTKKAVKKSAKKEEPKIVLIDGLYSHKFNCRILPASGEAMNQMMVNKGLKSYNKAINMALLEYNSLKTEIDDLREQVRKANSSKNYAMEIMNDFKSALSSLQTFEVNRSDDDDQDDDRPRGQKRQSEIGECDLCGADDEPVYSNKGMKLCESCLESELD